MESTTRKQRYKVWDTEHKLMIGIFDIRELFYEDEGFTKEQIQRHIYLEDTGLKDKNGVEIFVGDILSNPRSALPSDQKIEVYFENGSFMGDYIRLHQHEPENCLEIIGNRFENPNLLNRAK